MKINYNKITLVLSVYLFVFATIFSQNVIAGNLNPPAGAPVSTMKTMDEVEARKPLQSTCSSSDEGMYVINESGSYYLTGEIIVRDQKHGIIRRY